MLRTIPVLSQILERRRLARMAREAPSLSAAEHAAAVRRIIEQARAER
ncbi:hypothetical protein BJ973_007415 [Actinoplanes tereljensis]|uniref:Uncharacterized protein n=1 Tax=Paractinoplanes tereljensis TaxID=571912 RepID=A0A919TWI2_9ACTN|nr:hypothetical protein [Actinoplanes tereljensis]GIF25161.1 hypothetical protein Ate02nite_78910 [Actinoplanes tereljensis]